MVDIMNDRTNKFTTFTRVFAVAFAAAITITSFSSTASAETSREVRGSVAKSIAKSNQGKVRQTGKEAKPRNLGNYKTQVKVNTLSNKMLINKSSESSKLDIRLRGSSVQSNKDIPQASTSAFGFEIFDASVYLVGDRDGDGYYSDFDIEMDVDIDTGSANVYAEVYFLNDNGDWQWLSTTDVFSITGNLATDSFTTAITLVDGFPANYYDLLIDVYEDGFAGIVATFEPLDDADLGLIPLEDLIYDASANSNELFLDRLSMTLLDDFDLDGFYTEFEYSITLDNDTYGRNLKAVFYTRDTVTNWVEEVTTASVFVNRGDSVSFFIDGDWETGYPTDYYDFLVEIVDADTGEIVNDFGPEYQAMFEQPMESYDFDATGNVVYVEESYSSGSTGSILLLLMLLTMLVRVATNNKCYVSKE